MKYQAIIEQVEAADIAATAYRAARRLLDRAMQDRHTLPSAELCRLCGVGTIQSARRLLTALKNAGILRYTCGHEMTDIAFVAFDDTIQNGAYDNENGAQEDDATRQNGASTRRNGAHEPDPARQNGSQPDAPRAEMDRERAEMAREDTKTARQRAEMARSHNGTGWLVGIPDPDTNQPTNGKPPEPPEQSPANDPALEALAFSILVDPAVGVAPKRAKKLAHDFPFQEIRRQVFGWLTEFRDGKVQVGALIKRIEGDWAMSDPKPEIDPVLWGRYRTPDERRAEAEAEAELAEMLEVAHRREQSPEPESPPPSPSPDHDDPWAMVVAEINFQFPHGLLERTQAEAIGLNGESEVWQITLALQDAPEFTWMSTKGAIAIRKTLKTILRRAVLVDVILPEQEAA